MAANQHPMLSSLQRRSSRSTRRHSMAHFPSMAIIIRGIFPPFCGFMNILEGAAGREGTLFVVETSQPGDFSIIIQANQGPKPISLHRTCHCRLCNIDDPNCYNGSKTPPYDTNAEQNMCCRVKDSPKQPILSNPIRTLMPTLSSPKITVEIHIYSLHYIVVHDPFKTFPL